jgi:hypothetical protein
MTAPIGNTANRFTGLREFSNVTNSYGGYLQSGGVAYDLTLPFFPDKFEWYNYTAFATDSSNVQGVWYRDMPAGDALIVARGTTTLSTTLETTNGITDASTAGGFYDEHLVITGITTATPGVVTTSTDHNLSDYDRVVLTKIVGTAASELNNKTFVVRVVSATTFSLYDVYGVPVTVVGAYTSGGQVTKIAPALGDPSAPVYAAYPHKGIIDLPPVVTLTLGSAIMGADNDIIYFTAWQFNNYVNRGDVA